MISKILDFSVHQRWLVVLLSLLAAGFGVFSLTKLPIDAVPDITNNQVQINTVGAVATRPVDIEKQVTYPVETALAGIKGLEYTRSLSRNGFSQVTAVFNEKLDIYFARQQVASACQPGEGRTLPPGGPSPAWAQSRRAWARSTCGRSTTPSRRSARSRRRRQAGWQSDGSYLTPEGQRLAYRAGAVGYLRTVQDWIIRPADQDRAGRRRRRRHRGLREAVPRPAGPDEADMP